MRSPRRICIGKWTQMLTTRAHAMLIAVGGCRCCYIAQANLVQMQPKDGSQDYYEGYMMQCSNPPQYQLV